MARRVYSRPPEFRLKREHDLSKDVVAFYGGRYTGTKNYYNSVDWIPRLDGTLTGYTNPAAAWGRENGRAALTFNGNTNFVSLPFSGVFPTTATVSFWWKPNGSYTTRQHIIGNCSALGWTSFIVSFGLTDNKLEVWANSQNWGYPASAASISTNTWKHVAVRQTKVGSLYFRDLYIDGRLDSSNATALAPNVQAGQSLSIGRDGARDMFYLNGWISDVVLHLSFLDASQIQILGSPDPLYDGWIQPIPTRRYFYAPAGAAGTMRWPWQQRRLRRTSGAR